MESSSGPPPSPPTRRKVRFGLLRGKVKVRPDFDAPLELLPAEPRPGAEDRLDAQAMRHNLEHPARVISDPSIMGGVACLAGSRLSAQTLVHMVDGGNAWERIVASWPWLTPDHVEAARAYLAAYRRESRPLSWSLANMPDVGDDDDFSRAK